MQKRKPTNFNYILYSYQENVKQVVANYQQEMDEIEKEGLNILKDQFGNYKASKRKYREISEEFIFNEGKSKNEKPSFKSKKYAKSYTCQKDKIPKKHLEPDVEEMKEFHMLPQISAYFSVDEQENMNTGNHKIEPPSRSISQIIQESQVKYQPTETSVSEASEYDMTDYSSNESSNEGDDNFHYKDIEVNPRVHKLFSQQGGTGQENNNPNQPQTAFKMKNIHLMYSPKKTQLSKVRRLFNNSKKIPRWAEDLHHVDQTYAEQSEEGSEIFGVSMVQSLNTNIIFSTNDDMSRTSSAKWNPKLFEF